MCEQLVLGGALLPSARAELRIGWGVAVCGGVVGDVGPNEQLAAVHPRADVVDARPLLILPGMVDAHVHGYGVLAHGMPFPSVPNKFERFLEDLWWARVEDRLDEEMIQAAFRLTCANLIRSGVTSVCDVLEAPLVPDGILDVQAEELESIGLRGVLSLEVSERHGRSLARRAMEENERFARACGTQSGVRGMMSLHTSFTCSPRLVTQAKERAVALGCDLHLHLSESDYEPRTCEERYATRPVFWYDQLGLWDPSVLASQVVCVEEEEIALLCERGVRVAHMPLSNCEVGGGIARVPKMLACGMQPALGTDGYITDMFQVMRGAFLIHKAAERDPSVLPARTVLAMATAWGASGIGLSGLGELAPGRPADLIGISMQFDTPLTKGNVAEQVVLSGDPSLVELVMVGGRILVSGGELLGVDLDSLRRQVNGQAARLWGMQRRG